MDINENKMDLGEYVNNNSILWDFCWHLYKLEKILESEEIRYLYLANLISSDVIIDEESAQHSLEELNFIKNNIKYINIDEVSKKKINNFVNKGLKIIKRDLKNFNKK